LAGKRRINVLNGSREGKLAEFRAPEESEFFNAPELRSRRPDEFFNVGATFECTRLDLFEGRREGKFGNSRKRKGARLYDFQTVLAITSPANSFELTAAMKSVSSNHCDCQ
jgi:hypothetical protein